jgi:RND family efflux transporter MFP subunit
MNHRLVRNRTIVLALLAVRLLATPGAAAEASFDCVIDPSRTIKVSSPDIGLLAEVSVERGDRVKRGQVIARLESAVETGNVALRRTRAEATADIEAQQERLALARKTYDRGTQMADNAAIPVQELDELQSKVRINELELARVELERELARLELERARAALEKRTIRSPINGIVTVRQLSPGEFVDNDTFIVEIAQLDPLHVEAFLPVSLYPRVHQGMQALVKPKEPFTGSYEAEILTVDQVVDSASGTFGLRLVLPNPGQSLPAGLRCEVTLPIE